MLTKSTLVVMATTALIIVCSPVLSWKGVGRGMRGDGVVKLEAPPAPVPLCPCGSPEGPLWLASLNHLPLPEAPGPPSPILEPHI